MGLFILASQNSKVGTSQWRGGGRRSLLAFGSLWLVLQGGAGCAAQETDDAPGDGPSAGSASGGSAGTSSSSGGSKSGSAGAPGGGGMGTAGAPGGGGMGTAGNAQAGTGGSAAVGGSGGNGGNGGNGGASGGRAGAGGAGGAGGTPTDDCPNDPQKTEPGACGCGVSELCAALETGLAHRYSFSGANTTATDSIGNAHGTIVGVAAAAGKVTFNGTDDDYVDLPNGIVSSLSNASFEVWFTWGGGPVWQRIFDFGSNSAGEGNRGTGLTYLYITPSEGDAGNALRTSFSLNSNGDGDETTTRASAPLPTGSVQHIVLVVDDTGNQLRLYLNATQVGSVAYNGVLSGINDVNVWLGRSNWNDPPLNGAIDEFRIYDVALSAAQVTASKDFGPDPAFL